MLRAKMFSLVWLWYVCVDRYITFPNILMCTKAFSIGVSITIAEQIHSGMGQHIYNLTPEQIKDVLMVRCALCVYKIRTNSSRDFGQ